MAEVEAKESAVKIADVARCLNLSVGALGPRRSSLIRKGMIYSPSHGNLAFSVPLFGDYLQRTR